DALVARVEPFALLGPGSAGLREDPRGPVAVVVSRLADQRGGSVGRERQGPLVDADNARIAGDERFALLGPRRTRARQSHRRHFFLVSDPSDQRGAAAPRERTARAEPAPEARKTGAELFALLGPRPGGACEDPGAPEEPVVRGADQRGAAVA